ncbi:MAG: SGNH/GDSL hydrolase family protein, partial [Pseudomonadota bacterium]
RVRNEIAAPYAINAQGWNSGLEAYVEARTPGVPRIAVVGDSYVEALQVPPDASMAERLSETLYVAADKPGEVYRFGMSGAPLSQYVHMARREVADYRPDWLVVLLIHNDFDESFRFQAGRYASSFLKFDVNNGQVAGEIPPKPLQPSSYGWFRNFATLRFLVYRWQVRPDVILANLFSSSPADAPAEPPAEPSDAATQPADVPPAEPATAPEFAANVNLTDVLTVRSDVEAATSYGFEQLQRAADDMGANLLLVMDGDRRSLREGNKNGPALVLNEMAAREAEKLGIAFLDLQPVFSADWDTHQRRFEHDVDNHWNAYGHDVAAQAVADYIRRHTN